MTRIDLREFSEDGAWDPDEYIALADNACERDREERAQEFEARERVRPLASGVHVSLAENQNQGSTDG